MYLLYLLVSWVMWPLVLPVVSLMAKTRQGFWQRQGFYKAGVIPPQGSPRIWLHGASAGDLLALSPMIDRLRARFPQACIVVSTMTNTGQLMALERMKGKADAVIYVPWDSFGATRRAVATIKPDVLVLEYTEIWPNLIHAAHAAGCKLVLTNGRFSQQHLPKYSLLFSLIGNSLLSFDRLLMRSEDEAERSAFYSNLLSPALPDFEKFIGLRSRIEHGKLTQEQVANEAGISQQSVSLLLSFSGLPKEAILILESVSDKGLLGASAAAKLAQLAKAGKQGRVVEAVQQLADGKLSQVAAVGYASSEDKSKPQTPKPLVIRSGKKVFCSIRSAAKDVRISFAEPVEEKLLAQIQEVIEKHAKQGN